MLHILQNGSISLLAVAVVLGIMVLIHEWGHYIVAKSLGVTVTIFSIGFGKRIAGYQKNGTDYRISALPFGGYVKMAGDNPLESRTDDPGEFLNHPRWHRFLIAVAGPAVNIAFAVLLLFVLFMFRYERPLPVIVGHVEENSAEQQAGLQPGDRILRIGDHKNPNWMDVFSTVALSPNQPVNLTVSRNGETKLLHYSPTVNPIDQTGKMNFEPAQPMVVTDLAPGMPAQQAGIHIGDTIHAVNGHPVYSIYSLSRTLQDEHGSPVQIALTRAGQPLTVNLTPRNNGTAEKPLYQVGIVSMPVEIVKLSPIDSLRASLQENTQFAGTIFELIGKMVERKVSIKAISGPIGMAQASGQVAREPGMAPKARFMALISINLGVMNLLPIPILDGGVILLLFVESLMRRDISLDVKERIYQASFVFLVLFAAV
ncbi:MAG: RIP metalloprotease RseP, partial [Acidobacteriales bacterium]|nr:RIP metalloprotease RseP [Terriglobales bacterium]